MFSLISHLIGERFDIERDRSFFFFQEFQASTRETTEWKEEFSNEKTVGLIHRARIRDLDDTSGVSEFSFPRSNREE